MIDWSDPFAATGSLQTSRHTLALAERESASVLIRQRQASEEEVVGVNLSNKPGTLAEAAEKLASVGINFKHGYTEAEEGSKKQLVVFAVSDLAQAGKALK